MKVLWRMPVCTSFNLSGAAFSQKSCYTVPGQLSWEKVAKLDFWNSWFPEIGARYSKVGLKMTIFLDSCWGYFPDLCMKVDEYLKGLHVLVLEENFIVPLFKAKEIDFVVFFARSWRSRITRKSRLEFPFVGIIMLIFVKYASWVTEKQTESICNVRQRRIQNPVEHLRWSLARKC